MQIKPNHLVVFEGMDKTGKSTQLERVSERVVAPTLHMPSGDSELAQRIYGLTEDIDKMQPLTRQYLHLAAHANTMPALHTFLSRNGVIMDRWWWSAVAYGYYGDELDVKMSISAFMAMLAPAWSGVRADMVFLFLERYEEDDRNNDRVREGYEKLYEQNQQVAVRVPRMNIEDTTGWILDKLRERNIVVEDK